jgi:hypothetical protein
MSVKKFKRISDTCEAVQWRGDNLQEMIDLNIGLNVNVPQGEKGAELIAYGNISGKIVISVGSYIVKEPNGYVHICEGHKFESLFKEIEE